MENQEQPKKLSLEEIEQQKQTIEQKKDEEVEKPIKSGNTAPLSEITEKIAEKEQTIESTKNKINEIRDELGLPLSDEIPPSIKASQDSIEKLKQEKSQIEENIAGERDEIENNNLLKNSETMPGASVLSKETLDLIFEVNPKLNRLIANLEERDSNGYTMFFDEEGIKDLAKASQKFAVSESTAQLDESVNDLKSIFESSLNIRPRGIREDGDSTDLLHKNLNSLSDSIGDLSRKMINETSGDKEKQLSRNIYLTQGAIDEIKTKVARLKEFI